VIDLSVLVGGSPRLTPSAQYSLHAARSELQAHGISAALIASRTGAAYRPEVGNDLALSAAGTADGLRLYPVGSVNPVQYLDCRAELERVLAAGVVAIQLFPEIQGWSVVSEAFSAIATTVRGRCPLLVPVSRFGDATAIGAATAGLDVPVVLLGGHYTQLGDCLAALERWPHLHLETSHLGQFRGIETVVKRVGAERVLFGSRTPARPIQAALNAVLTADISDDARRSILAGNARRLFAISHTEPRFETQTPTRASGLIDVHTHFGALAYPTPVVDARQLKDALAKHGIAKAVGSSLRAITDDLQQGNAEAFEAATDDLRAYVVVNPNELEASCRAMDAAYAGDRAVGAKLHCSYTGHLAASRQCLAMVREVARRGRPLKIHVDGAGWDDALGCVADEFPNWKLIVAHGGPGTPSREAACLVERTTNVYLELSTSFPDLPVVREVVRRVGPRRLLFGSDAPLLEPAYVQGIYADGGADLSCTSEVAADVFDL
jgi:predicted TIM-barrel fold metal-dependent hydrolase